MADGYDNFLDRIQKIFSPSQMTYQNILGQLGKPAQGRRSIAQQFARVSIVAGQIGTTEDYDELRNISSEIDALEARKHGILLKKQVQTKLDRVGKELAELAEERRATRLDEERIEKDRTRLIREREKYENIKKETDDRRKRRNAERNLEKIEERLEKLE